MKPGFFIDRPIFSAVLSIVIVLVGFIGLFLLPVDQYPQITPPVVKISASYPGASAVTVSQAVATPIEQELNGTPGMLYMESSSSNSGRSIDYRDFRHIHGCRTGRRRYSEPRETGRIPSSGRSRAERDQGGETIFQPVDDSHADLIRPSF